MSLKEVVDDVFFEYLHKKENKGTDGYPGCDMLKCENFNLQSKTIIDTRVCFFCDVYKTHQSLNNKEPYFSAVDRYIQGGC